jgi:hypothetical protein
LVGDAPAQAMRIRSWANVEFSVSAWHSVTRTMSIKMAVSGQIQWRRVGWSPGVVKNKLQSFPAM